MQITNELLQDLNIFRNDLIIKVEQIEDIDIVKLIKNLQKQYKDLEIELMNIKLDENAIKEICRDISALCFLISQKLEGKINVS